jgi:hypothetical protein
LGLLALCAFGSCVFALVYQRCAVRGGAYSHNARIQEASALRSFIDTTFRLPVSF